MRVTSLLLSAVALANLATPGLAYRAGQEQAPPDELLDSAFKQVAVTMTNTKSSGSEDLIESVQPDAWKRSYLAGRKAAEIRDWEGAEHKLLDAMKMVKQGIPDPRKLIWTRSTLGDVYLAEDRFEESEKLFSWSAATAKHAIGAESDAEAHAQYGLAASILPRNRCPEAQELCKDAIKTRKKLYGTNDREYGQYLILMGRILAKQGWADQADRFFTHGLTVLERNPGEKELDYADALRYTAIFKQNEGDRATAQTLFEKSYAIKDKAVSLDQPAHLKGTVRFQWEEGSPRSLEITDAEVPVRYICTNGVRVATAVIDLWELFGILISVTDVGDHRTEIGLGKVVFMRTSNDPNDPKAEKLELVAPDHIDRIRREMDIWRLTANRPWLANMQKTRNMRGLVPAHGHDLFRGPNVFGIYGEWNATTRVLPDRFALEPSPERVEEQAEVVVDPGLVHANNTHILGLTPVALEPFESRTGELFYMNPRCEHVMLRVWVGNSAFDFPFKMPKKRTAM